MRNPYAQQRELYPANWKDIATSVKTSANWRCQECDRPCRKPKEAWDEFCGRLLTDEPLGWHYETYDEVSDDSGLSTCIDRPQRFTLTVADLDRDPANCETSNLKAMCSGCHRRYDAALHRANASATRYKKREATGQINLLTN